MATGLVVALHILLLWLLLRATVIQVPPRPEYHEAPITLWLRTAPKPKPPTPKPEKEKKTVSAPPVAKSLGVPLPTPAPSAPPASEYNGLRAFGHYLNNCSNLSYDYLSAHQLAQCLGGQFGKPGEASVRLGKEPPSIWKKQMEERKKPPRDIEHACDQDKLNSNLGLPCYNFAN